MKDEKLNRTKTHIDLANPHFSDWEADQNPNHSHDFLWDRVILLYPFVGTSPVPWLHQPHQTLPRVMHNQCTRRHNT